MVSNVDVDGEPDRLDPYHDGTRIRHPRRRGCTAGDEEALAAIPGLAGAGHDWPCPPSSRTTGLSPAAVNGAGSMGPLRKGPRTARLAALYAALHRSTSASPRWRAERPSSSMAASHQTPRSARLLAALRPERPVPPASRATARRLAPRSSGTAFTGPAGGQRGRGRDPPAAIPGLQVAYTRWVTQADALAADARSRSNHPPTFSPGRPSHELRHAAEHARPQPLALRQGIIATCIEMNRSGLNQGTSGNVSHRIEGGMLITPTSLPYERMEPTTSWKWLGTRPMRAAIAPPPNGAFTATS